MAGVPVVLGIPVLGDDIPIVEGATFSVAVLPITTAMCNNNNTTNIILIKI